MIFHKKEEKKKTTWLCKKMVSPTASRLWPASAAYTISSAQKNHDSMKHNLKIITEIHDELKIIQLLGTMNRFKKVPTEYTTHTPFTC